MSLFKSSKCKVYVGFKVVQFNEKLYINIFLILNLEKIAFVLN